MNEARKFAKGRKPVKHIWTQRRRPVLVKRKDVTPEAWDFVPVWRKYPKRLLDELNKGPCMKLKHRAASLKRTFVGPPKPERKHKVYPQTNWKRKHLDVSRSLHAESITIEQSACCRHCSPPKSVCLHLVYSIDVHACSLALLKPRRLAVDGVCLGNVLLAGLRFRS